MRIAAIVSLIFLVALAASGQPTAMTFTYQLYGPLPPAQTFTVLTYTSLQTGTAARIYLPFDVRLGDPDCQWVATKTPTTIALTSNANPSTFGQSTVLTATVSPSSATGAVTFFDGNTLLGGATVSMGKAALSVSALAIGSHSITAIYSGDNSCSASSAVLTQIVSPPPTTITVASSDSISTFAQSVTFMATVSPSAATGTVTFFDGSVALGSGKLSAGTAKSSIATLSVGRHPISATYGGDANYAGSTSTVLPQTVGVDPSTTTLSASTYTLTLGGSVTLAATVFPATATGTVTFYEGPSNPVVLGVVQLGAGQANLPISPATGSHTYTAAYSGDADTGSSSTVQNVTVTVNKAQSAIYASSNNPTSSITNPVPGPLFSATVSPQSATGYVVFSYSAGWVAGIAGTIACNGIASGNVPLIDGQAVCIAAPGLFPEPGVYVVTAVYSGDANYSGSTSSTIGVIFQTETP